MILIKTKDFIVINKPAGIPSQPDPTEDKDAMTLASEELSAWGEDGKLYLIHRLDRVVVGLLVFARNKGAAAHLSAAVSDHTMVKEYLAVVSGRAEGGLMRDYIYKDPTLGKAFIASGKRAGVKECELEYTNLDTVSTDKGEVSLVRIRLHTGRFHQIRAQFSSRGMPLLGDKKYGSRDYLAKMPALIATGLTFVFCGQTVCASERPPLTQYPWCLFGEERYR